MRNIFVTLAILLLFPINALSQMVYINGHPIVDLFYVSNAQFLIEGFSHIHTEGSVHWDPDDKTLSLDTEVAETSIQIGQEQVMRATNKTGSIILNGQVVYVDGSQGNRPTIALADADSADAHKLIGIATHNINNNDTGYVTTQGYVRDVDTSAWAPGTILYLSSTAGGLTNTPPGPPAHSGCVGMVMVQHASEGIICVRPAIGWDFNQLHDVLITNPADGEPVIYDSANGYFKNIGSYERHVQIPSGQSTLGPTAPTQTIYNTVADCLEFDNNAEAAYITLEVPHDWNGNTDMLLEVDWLPNDASMTNGQTVIWKMSYVARAQNEDMDGTLTNVTTIYTDSGGTTTQGVIRHTGLVLDWDDATNPMADQDHLYIKIWRDMTTDTFGGGACVTSWEWLYNSNKIPRI